MKAKEIIEKLQWVDPETEVKIFIGGHNYDEDSFIVWDGDTNCVWTEYDDDNVYIGQLADDERYGIEVL